METSAAVAVAFFLCFTLYSGCSADNDFTGFRYDRRLPAAKSLCAEVIERYRHPCSEHRVQTKDGYVLGLQRVSSRDGILRERSGPPVLLLHGLFMAGDAWFLDSTDQSLGYILADNGFDVWVGSVRGTRWSHGHVYLSETEKICVVEYVNTKGLIVTVFDDTNTNRITIKFWDWSWEELALHDVAAMLHYVNQVSNSKVFVVGHSQGTIMSLAAFTQPDIVKIVEGAAFLCPISYLKHITAPLVLRLVKMHLDQVVIALGIHQLNFKSDFGTQILDSVCDGHVDCNDLLTSITGRNCCFNNSQVDFYLAYEPHPSSSKNLNHLFQMIRKGTFAKYDYGKLRNLKRYGWFKPPKFDISRIPKSLPIWMAYGGNDALADMMDLQHTIEELQSTPELLYLENYGHVDFLLSTSAKRDVYDGMILFFRSLLGKSSSS